MDNKDRKRLEENDLRILHNWFESKEYDIAEMQEIDYPVHDTNGQEDLWSEVLEILVSRDENKYRMISEKIKRSNMSPESIQWWGVVLASMMNAPLDELEKYTRRLYSLSDHPDATTIMAAARVYGEIAWEKEQQRIKKIKDAERAKERALQQEAARREADLHVAEENLRRHRNSRS